MSGLQVHKKTEIEMAKARLEIFKRRFSSQSSGQSPELTATKTKPLSAGDKKVDKSPTLCESITLLVKIKEPKSLKKGTPLSYDLATRDESTDKFVKVISDDTIEVVKTKDFRIDMNGSIDNDYYTLPTLKIIGGRDNPDMNSHKLTGNSFGFKTILSLNKGDKIRIIFDQDVTVDSFNMFIS